MKFPDLQHVISIFCFDVMQKLKIKNLFYHSLVTLLPSEPTRNNQSWIYNGWIILTVLSQSGITYSSDILGDHLPSRHPVRLSINWIMYISSIERWSTRPCDLYETYHNCMINYAFCFVFCVCNMSNKSFCSFVSIWGKVHEHFENL